MNAAVAAAAVAALAMIAAAGVVAGFRRRVPIPVEPLADPLEDRRVALLRSRADLEEAHASGALEDADYRRLREDGEGRMARLLGAIEERRRRREGAIATAGAGGVTASEPSAAASDRMPARVPPWAVATILAATVLAVAVAGLLRDAEPVSGTAAPATSADDPLAFFEDRVRDHPNDLAARLDLAHRYLDAERFEEALDEYAVALELAPDDAEAHAHVGLILYRAGRPDDALDEVDRALEEAPGYPEALFIRGVVLLRGLDRPAAAVGALEAYLEAAPFGSERGTAETLLEEAEAALTGAVGAGER